MRSDAMRDFVDSADSDSGVKQNKIIDGDDAMCGNRMVVFVMGGQEIKQRMCLGRCSRGDLYYTRVEIEERSV